MGRLLDSICERSTRAARTRAWLAPRRKRVLTAFVLIMHVLGALTSMRAVMSTRTPQGAVAWAVSLNTFPYVAVPAYWVFGQSKFDGYEMIRHQEFLARSAAEQRAMRILREEGLLHTPRDADEASQMRLYEKLSLLPLTRGNEVELLIDGERTFDAILKSIASAQDYVLFQFYILRSDALGERLKDALLERAAAGVRCFVLYDAYGSKDISSEYVQELRAGGVQTGVFDTTDDRSNRFRLNFRNHRKVVVIDGRESFVGGHNVGVEYLGKDPKYGAFRDTHVAMRGPVVLTTQVSFVEDWHWVTGQALDLEWTPRAAPEGDVLAACFPTGPADPLESMNLLTLDLITSAKERLWIATPYFVPDEQLVSALQLAALRGVDVRIIIPDNNNNTLVDLTTYSYLSETSAVGIKVYRYEPGFMHQKVILVDADTSLVGTANFDNRSMRLNFEITMLFNDKAFASEVDAMLSRDMARSRLMSATEFEDGSLPFRFAVRAARLLAPIL